MFAQKVLQEREAMDEAEKKRARAAAWRADTLGRAASMGELMGLGEAEMDGVHRRRRSNSQG